MEELRQALNRVLADTFLMYIKAHAYHWNVVGPNFSQYHEFFGKLYEELWSAVDVCAEHIRVIDGFAPGNLLNYANMATVDLVNDELNPFPSEAMFMQLAVDNQKVIESLKIATEIADSMGQRGLVNFLEERLDIHGKHGWMLKANVRQGQ
jgi:starvation-inducible DNA-binding protein